MAENIDPAVAALAADIESVRDELAKVPSDTELEAVKQQVANLAAGLSAISDQILAGGAAGGGDVDDRPDAPKAQALADIVDGDGRLEYLRATNEWLAHTGHLLIPQATFPSCWPWHPQAVQALHDAMQTWETLYRSRQGTMWMLMDWYKSYWTTIEGLVRRLLEDCETRHQDPRGGRSPVATDAVLTAAAAR